MLASLTQALLTVLGAASEATGIDKVLKANTVTKRTHPLFRHGCVWFALLPKAPAHRRHLMLNKFDELLREQQFFANLFGVV